MKLGIIARCDNRGIAYQSLEAVHALQPERVLVVLLHDRRWPEQPDRFARFDAVYADSDLTTRQLGEKKMAKFLDGLDVVFAVETVYDWRLIDMAHERGVRVVIQGNPEFYTHHLFPDRPKPDLWVWPTTWMTDHEDHPGGPLLPVPSPEPTSWIQADPEDEVLRILHVAGHRAKGDRNGTDLFMQAIPLLGSRVHVTVVGQDGALPDTRLGRHVTMETIPGGLADRWEMYQNQHIVVLPRRYGGLCLPAIEACAMGAVPMMPDVPENSLWPKIPLGARTGRLERVPFGRVPTWAVRPNSIAYEIDKINRSRDVLTAKMDEAADWAVNNDWGSWMPHYLDALAP